MAETPINLNRVRKARARSDRKAAADRNAVLHGLTKAQKAAARAEAERINKLHEAARRDNAGSGAVPDDAPDGDAPDHGPTDRSSDGSDHG
ncbi:MAG: DUF4169 family protein [Celeribacter sp.]